MLDEAGAPFRDHRKRSTAVDRSDTAFLGHPRGLAFLAFTQAWERFSFYGMQALLTLYMVDQLLLPGHVEHVLGFDLFRSALEGVLGPLTTLALASQVFGLYAGLVNLTPLIGAWLSDRVLGQRRTAIAGLVSMAAGHLLMASEAAFLIALMLLLVGAGLVKGTMYTQVGNLYSSGDARRSHAFSIYLIALNVGAFFAPLVCGTLGEVYGWHYGFGAAGIGMAVGLAIYVSGWRYLPPDREVSGKPVAVLARGDWRCISAIALMLLPTVLIYCAATQAYNLAIVWASTQVDRTFFGTTFPVTWFLTFDGLMTIVGVIVAIPLWRWLAARQREPDTMLKVSIAGGLVVLGYLALAVGSTVWSVVPALVVLIFFTCLDLSYAWIDPPANAFVSRFSPKSVVTTMMSLNLMSFGISNVAAGWLGRFYEIVGATVFWQLHAAIAFAGVALAFALRPLIRRLLDDHPEGVLAAASTPF
jgi:POT family proton-dependent oligopeptide transporter